MNNKVTALARRSGPILSAASAITVTRAPPKPTPAKKRNAARCWKVSAAAQAKVVTVVIIRAMMRMGLRPWRSEEHTSELQSLMRISYAVFCLKKKNRNSHKSYNRKKTQYDKRRNIDLFVIPQQ